MVDLKIMKEMGNQTFKVVKGIYSFYECGIIAPTKFRKLHEMKIDIAESTFGIWAAAFLSHSFISFPIYKYLENTYFDESYANYCSASILATNVASGLYEWYRYVGSKQSANANKTNLPASVPANSASSLEQKLENPVVPVVKPVIPDVSSPVSYFDPWSIKVPKVQDKKRNE